MSEEKRDIVRILPPVVIFIVLLILENTFFSTYLAAIPSAGENGPIPGTQATLALIVMVLACLGLISICRDTSSYKKMASLSLVLFIVQMVFTLIAVVISVV